MGLVRGVIHFDGDGKDTEIVSSSMCAFWSPKH